MSNKVSIKNSTSTVLLADETFYGLVEDVTEYNSILIYIFSDQDSDNTGLKIQFSDTSTNNFDKIFSYTYFKNISKNYNIPVSGRYFKIIYKNGSTNQTNFRLRVVYNHLNSNNNIVQINKKYLDSFNRLRTSDLNTILDISQIYSKNNLKEDEYTNGSGSVSHNVNESTNTLSVSANNDRVIRQSRIYTKYQPGKSFIIYLTGCINNNNNQTNTVSRLGYFDDNNGIYFEYDGSDMYIVKRSYTSGSIVNTKVIQSEWNVDPMNGNGLSGINIDFSKYLIYTINFSWLGAGIIDIGIFYSGENYILHHFSHTDITEPYMTTPDLPSRYEILSSGVGNNSGQLKQGCVSINTESSQYFIGHIFSQGTTSLRTINDNETYIFGIRLKDNTRKIVRLQSISIICTSKGNIEYKIYLDLSPTTSPITANSDFTDVNTNSVVQYDEDGTDFNKTNSILLYQGYFSTLINIDVRELSNKGDPIFITAGIDVGTYYSDYLYITGRKLNGSNNENISLVLNWIEI